MARKKYTTDEIIKHLRTMEIEKAKARTMEELARSIGVHAITLAKWKREYGGMQPDQAKKLKDLEKENARLKRLLADAELDKSMMKEVIEGNY
jgi:methylphosphotriester-DNA--protein-cysteine methyltransferase